MPRHLRIQYPGAVYHVMSRGNRRAHIYLDDVDRQDFLKTLAEACRKTDWQVHAYCLMSNHYHLVLAGGGGPARRAPLRATAPRNGRGQGPADHRRGVTSPRLAGGGLGVPSPGPSGQTANCGPTAPRDNAHRQTDRRPPSLGHAQERKRPPAHRHETNKPGPTRSRLP